MDNRAAASQTSEGGFSPAYVRYVLFTLMLINALSYLDRSIINILSQAIKKDLNLSDTQIGVLSGIAFAFVYTFCALPIAWVAERKSRVTIISVCVGVWSAMTALCGMATSFVQLLFFRMGVGMGEAGGAPSAHSLISDYVPPNRRGSAISVFVFGNALGILFGSVIGGFVAQHFSWRIAFFLVGLPGLLITAVIRLTIREPERGASEMSAGVATQPARSFLYVAKHVFSRPAFVHILIGFTVIGAVVPGIAAFLPAFFIRHFSFNYAATGLIVGLLSGLTGALGTLYGGYLTDKTTRHDKRWFGWMPAAILLVCGPLFILGFAVNDWRWSMAILAVPFFLKSAHFAPTFAAIHNMVEPRMRATAITISLIFANALGGGLGPVIAGMLSDFFAARHFGGEFSTQCSTHATHAAGLAHQCASSSAYGATTALIVISVGYFWGAAHYFLAAKYIRQDLIA